MDRQQAHARINSALNTLRVYGWTVEQRNRLVDGLPREDAVEIAEHAVENIGQPTE